MKRPGLATFAALLIAIVPAVAGSMVETTRPVTIIDGDTIAIGRERIRILGIDAPESFRSRCENELVLGLKAKERLRQLVDRGPLLIERHGRDRYGRTLATVSAGDRDVGAVLLAEGLALAWRPGPEAKHARLAVWCDR